MPRLSSETPPKPAPRAATGRPLSDVEVLLDGARAAFAEDGYHQATMADVAGWAQVSKPTLYAHFTNKNALYVAAVSREAERLRQHLFAAYESGRGQSLESQIRLGFGALFDYAEAEPQGFRLLFTSSDDSPATAIRRDLRDGVRARVTQTVADYAEQHDLAMHQHAPMVATWLVDLAIEAARHQMTVGSGDLQTARDLSASFALAGLRHMQA